MSQRHSLTALLLGLVSLAACSSPPPKPPPAQLGPENCTNGVDDNGDGKTDCADPLCFKYASCVPVFPEDCTNGSDDDGNSLADCADPACAAKSCGSGCACEAGVARERVCNDGVDNDNDGAADCPDPECAQASNCVGAQSEAGKCNNGLDDDGDGFTDCADVSDCEGSPCATGCSCSGGMKKETLCSDDVDNDGDTRKDCADPDCSSATGCVAIPTEAGKCNNGLDDDSDGLTDCQDTADCDAAPCGAGCSCAGGAKKESLCSDGSDNDSDSKIDCADPDCLGAGTENCSDGVDNTCDRAIDCGDPSCAGNSACSGLSDGKPCTANTQCQGGKCLTEAATGAPNGACSNQVSCTVSTNAGCNGGICVEAGSFDVCREKCTGTGLAAPGKCRRGFACLDADTDTSNANNHCEPLCASDADCAGSGANFGCNPWSHLCESRDKGLSKYGAACTSNAQCETNRCSQNKPGGYCLGLCSGTDKACGGTGACYYYASFGDNVGACLQGCASTSQCRGTPYSCLDQGLGSVCWCRVVDEPCSLDGQCCSGYCNPNFGYTCD